MIEADCLVLLSDVDGLYTAPPGKDPDATPSAACRAPSRPTIEAMAGGAASHLSRGGMTTKIEAGKIATQAGTAMIIAKGTDDASAAGAARRRPPHPVRVRRRAAAQARKRWIMGTLDVAGALQVDAGAARALLTGKSLLPIGVTRVKGEFARGDAVSILDPDGREIARGLAGLDSEEAAAGQGQEQRRASSNCWALGSRAELVHRDNHGGAAGHGGEGDMSAIEPTTLATA